MDHNATTPVDERVATAMAAAAGLANPSSVHEEGRRARDAVEKARAEVAALCGAAPSEVIFTSGGTEADWLGVVGGARAGRAAGRPARVVASPLEHPAVRGALAQLAGEGFEIVLVPADGRGRLEAARGEAALAVFARANHELGNVYDAAALAGGNPLHCDAVQAAGRVPVAMDGVDFLALSAHKLGGPKGVGALVARRGRALEPLFTGGHQERGMRPGTENVMGIVGFGEAARLARVEGPGDVGRLRDRLERGALAITGARVNGDPGARLPNTTNLAFEGAPGELVMMSLDLEGIAVSTGSACTSGSIEPSAVVLALGQARDRAKEAVRFSLGKGTTAEDVDRVLASLPAIIARIRAA
jgi:cysteine desulfurase